MLAIVVGTSSDLLSLWQALAAHRLQAWGCQVDVIIYYQLLFHVTCLAVEVIPEPSAYGPPRTAPGAMQTEGATASVCDFHAETTTAKGTENSRTAKAWNIVFLLFKKESGFSQNAGSPREFQNRTTSHYFRAAVP